MNDYFVDYGQNVKVLFHDVTTLSGIDNAIRYGLDLFSIEEKVMLSYFTKPGDIVYDIGSYVGSYSILFLLNGNSQVYAFEPSPFNYPRCVKNCRPFRQIKVFDVAFHEKEYDVVTKFKDCNNITCDNNDAEQFIKYRILEKYMKENNLPNPDFIKMDLEGMETVVLKTMDFLFKGCRPVVYIEMHQKPKETPDLQKYDHNPNWLWVSEGGMDWNELKKYDYEFWNFHGDYKARKITYDMDFNKIEAGFVLVPKEKSINFEDYNNNYYEK